MKGVKGLLHYYEELEKDFHHQYVDVLREAREEPVHHMRVNMKKQTAFFHLLEYLDPTFSAARALEAYGKVYKRAGKVRNYQVEKGVVKKEEEHIGIDPDFSAWLEEREAAHCERLQTYELAFSLVPARRLGKLVRNRLSFLAGEDLRERLLAYFRQLFTAIRELLAGGLHDSEQLHALRKRIKELFYNLRLINEIGGKKTIHAATLRRVDNLQQLLGKWHDYDFTLARVREKQRHCPPELLARLEEACGAREQEIRKKVRQLPALIDTLEQKLTGRLPDLSPVTSPAPRSTRNKKVIRPSFKQVNVGEGTK